MPCTKKSMNPMLRRKKSVFAVVLKDTKRGKVAGGGGGGGVAVHGWGGGGEGTKPFVSGQNGIHQMTSKSLIQRCL